MARAVRAGTSPARVLLLGPWGGSAARDEERPSDVLQRSRRREYANTEYAIRTAPAPPAGAEAEGEAQAPKDNRLNALRKRFRIKHSI